MITLHRSFHLVVFASLCGEPGEMNGMTQAQAAGQMDWSPSKLMRIEGGAVSISGTDLMALCTLYRVGPTMVDELRQYASVARRRPWWHEFKADIPSPFATLIDLESDATRIQVVGSVVVPALLQTNDYARAVSASAHRLATHEPVDEQTMAAIRLRRQNTPARPRSKTVWPHATVDPDLSAARRRFYRPWRRLGRYVLARPDC